MFTANDFQNCFFLSYLGKINLNTSLNAKLNACVGNYLIQFVKLPLQNDEKPCSAFTLLKQSTIPVYLATSPEMILGLESCVCMINFTLSIGAVHVLAIVPETPPSKKS
jgi:hypothetical protein